MKKFKERWRIDWYVYRLGTRDPRGAWLMAFVYTLVRRSADDRATRAEVTEMVRQARRDNPQLALALAEVRRMGYA